MAVITQLILFWFFKKNYLDVIYMYVCVYIKYIYIYIYMHIALRNLRIIEDNRIIEDFRQEN